jgi:hypothetical protein
MNIPEIVIRKIYEYMMNKRQIYMVVRHDLTYNKYCDKGCRYERSGSYVVLDIFMDKTKAEKCLELENDNYKKRGQCQCKSDSDSDGDEDSEDYDIIKGIINI